MTTARSGSVAHYIAVKSRWGQLKRTSYHYRQSGNEPISGRVDRESATEAVASGSIPGRVKPKTIKIGIHSFPA